MIIVLQAKGIHLRRNDEVREYGSESASGKKRNSEKSVASCPFVHHNLCITLELQMLKKNNNNK